ncbi:MAG: ROK family protein [Planctomycetaceae bacterium]|nr:ROK family protein [Planctomycetaceae bacterium]
MSAPIPFVPLQNALKPLYFGIDVGGTSIKIGLVDSNGSSIDLKEFDASGSTQSVAKIATERNVEAATQSMALEILRLLEKHSLTVEDIAGTGLGIPGTMDVKTQRLRRPPNLPEWEGYPICQELSNKIGVGVVFCNDANAAAFGEYWVGSAKGHSSVALLTMGTGVGCGIIIDGRSVDGAIGYGGECGHIIIDISEDAKICGCGKRGHLEIYASATGVARRAISLTDTKVSSLRNRIIPETRLSDIPKLVCEEAEQGDQVSLDIIREAATYLGIGIVSMLNTIDPACVLIGGAMTFGGKGSPMGEKYIGWVREEINKRAFPAIVKALTLDFAVLGGDAGYIGAAGIAKSCNASANG